MHNDIYTFYFMSFPLCVQLPLLDSKFRKISHKTWSFWEESHKWTGNVSTSCKVKLCKDQLASENWAVHSTSVNIVFHPRWQATLSSSAFSHIYADASNLFGKLWGVFQLYCTIHALLMTWPCLIVLWSLSPVTDVGWRRLHPHL